MKTKKIVKITLSDKELSLMYKALSYYAEHVTKNTKDKMARKIASIWENEINIV
jgi:hypothetical protein